MTVIALSACSRCKKKENQTWKNTVYIPNERHVFCKNCLAEFQYRFQEFLNDHAPKNP